MLFFNHHPCTYNSITRSGVNPTLYLTPELTGHFCNHATDISTLDRPPAISRVSASYLFQLTYVFNYITRDSRLSAQWILDNCLSRLEIQRHPAFLSIIKTTLRDSSGLGSRHLQLALLLIPFIHLLFHLRPKVISASMAAAREGPACTICGLKIKQSRKLDRIDKRRPTRWFPDIWEECAILLSGPHFPYYGKGPKSFRIPSTSVSRCYAEACMPEPQMRILPDGTRILTQHAEPLGEDNRHHPNASEQWYFGVHTACEELALLAIETQKYSLRSMGDLWMTLDRRCTKTTNDTDLCLSFLPKIPENPPGCDIRLGFGRYFVPPEALLQFEDDWYGGEEWVRICLQPKF